MADLTLSQRLSLRAMSNANTLLDPPPKGIERPGYIAGWDKATASPIVRLKGALIVIRPTYNRAIGSGRSVTISATPG
jgi:hypothetical protein